MLPVLQVLGNKHSLYYEYTIQSRHSKNDIFDFTAMTVLDGRQIDSYRIRTPKQDWWKKLPQRGLQTGTDELQEYGHWLNDHLHSIIKELGQKKSDVHILQWRFGCEINAMFII